MSNSCQTRKPTKNGGIEKYSLTSWCSNGRRIWTHIASSPKMWKCLGPRNLDSDDEWPWGDSMTHNWKMQQGSCVFGNSWVKTHPLGPGYWTMSWIEQKCTLWLWLRALRNYFFPGYIIPWAQCATSQAPDNKRIDSKHQSQAQLGEDCLLPIGCVTGSITHASKDPPTFTRVGSNLWRICRCTKGSQTYNPAPKKSP